MTLRNNSFVCFVLVCLLGWGSSLLGARLKDISTIRGVRDNQLWGYGLVVGLSGTGDSRHEITESSLNMVLKGLGVDLKAKKFETKNAAAVLVSTMLRPFMGVGSTMDVTVSSIGSASSLEGGTLIMTSLQGADGKVYAVAQGKLVTSMRTGKGTKFLRQSMVSANVPNGATLEREVGFDFSDQRKLRYLLNSPDFTTASRTAKLINEELGARYATAVNAGTVDVLLPDGFTGNIVDIAARLEGISVAVDRRAKVVINQRTGTVIMGKHVEIEPSAIAHNNLRIEIGEQKPPTPQPTLNPPTRQVSSVARDIDSPSGMGSVVSIKGGTSVADIAESLNSLGAGPDDLILILQALKSSGALTAEVVTR